jgi:hypothetical protein
VPDTLFAFEHQVFEAAFPEPEQAALLADVVDETAKLRGQLSQA